MAEGKANLIIQLKDMASSGLKKLGNAFNGLKDHYLHLKTLAVDVFNGAMKFVEAYGNQREAVAKLDTALSNLDGVQEGASKRLQNLASEMQKVTTYGDEQIITMQALLANYGLNENAITQLTPKILDMAAATGTDLNTAAMALGRTLSTGTIGTLTRYGINVDEAAFKSDALGTVVKALGNQFGGVAKSVAGEPLGAIKQMQNAVGDLMEVIGELISRPLTIVIGKIQEFAQYLIENKEHIFRFANAVWQMGEILFAVFQFNTETLTTFSFALFETLAAINEMIYGNFVEGYQKMQDISSITFDSLTSDWSNMVEKIRSSVNSIKGENKKLVDDDKKTKTELLNNKIKDNEQNLAADKIQNAKLLADEKKNNADKQKELDASIAKSNAAKQKQSDFEKFLNSEKINSTMSLFSTISTMQQSHEKSAFAVGKAAALAFAIINTARGITEAIKFGPIIGTVFAAAIAAAGAVQIHTIAATSMAEGGIVLPTEGGTIARIGEAGKSEAIIPLDDSEAQAKLAEALGSRITVNINAGTIVADDYGIEELTKAIDRKLYQLQQNNETISM